MSAPKDYGFEECFLGGPGLDGYAFRADTYCEGCAKEIGMAVFAGGRRFTWAYFCDSEQVPHPIFFGESDCAQHCGACGEYLYGDQPEDEAEFAYFDRFDVVDAYYWWLADHHRGQWRKEYERLCRVGRYFRPGTAANGPGSENAQAIYANLCRRAGCVHEDQP